MAVVQGDLCRNAKTPAVRRAFFGLVQLGEARERVFEFRLFFFAGL